MRMMWEEERSHCRQRVYLTKQQVDYVSAAICTRGPYCGVDTGQEQGDIKRTPFPVDLGPTQVPTATPPSHRVNTTTTSEDAHTR